jgi:hypothetical protein
MIVSRFTDILGESKIPILDLAANYDELSTFLTERIQPEFATYGLEMTKMLVENISLPKAVEEALDKRASMGVIGDLSKYTQYQTAEAMRDAAKNPGGMAAGGMGMGMGFAMGNQMAQAMTPAAGQASAAPAPGAAPPPLPTAAPFHVALDGKQAGPYDMDALRGLIASGRVGPDTLVWQPGMAQWTRAGDVADLGDALGAAPPPLPPQT